MKVDKTLLIKEESKKMDTLHQNVKLYCFRKHESVIHAIAVSSSLIVNELVKLHITTVCFTDLDFL
jgi:hypothetical protein